jgi:hypothetical protein
VVMFDNVWIFYWSKYLSKIRQFIKKDKVIEVFLRQSRFAWKNLEWKHLISLIYIIEQTTEND